MKKSDILQEVLDSDGNLIGSDDKPANNPNEIGADGTTDRAAGIGHQHFAHDFLGRFGFYMYNEGEGENTGSTDELLQNIAQETYIYFEGGHDSFTPFVELSSEQKNRYLTFAQKIIRMMSDAGTPKEPIETPSLSEAEISKMIEDVIMSRTDKSIASKKNDNDILDSKVKDKLKTMLSKLSDKDKGDLVKHLNK